ncbi:MHYT domain-containing protein, partial [Undibacterium sp. CCC2.1]
AMVMGFAVAAMHYTAMAGASFSAQSFCMAKGFGIDTTSLALIVTALVLILFMGSFIISTFRRSAVLEKLRMAHSRLMLH